MSSKFSYSEPHICQCLTRLSTLRSDDVVTITGNRQKTGEQFADEVLCLARGLLQLGVATGDIVAISAFNRFSLSLNCYCFFFFVFVMINVNVNFCYSDMYMEWLLAIAFVGGIAAPLNYRWVSPHSSV